MGIAEALVNVKEFTLFLLHFGWALLLSVVDLLSLAFPGPKKSFDGQVILITGGASGIGRLLALQFAKRFKDVTVIIWDLNEAALEATAKEIDATGNKGRWYRVDVTNRTLVYETAARIKEELGRPVDVLVNNAGIVAGGHGSFLNGSDAFAQKVMEVNTMAHFWTVKAFLPDMIANNRGHFVTVASSAGLCGVNGLADYCASKAGAISFHENIRMELVATKKDGVDTLLVNPYFIDTGMFHGVQTKNPTVLPILQPEYVVEQMMRAIIGRRVMLNMPNYIYAITAYFSMPARGRDHMTEYLGIAENMCGFKQTRNILVDTTAPAVPAAQGPQPSPPSMAVRQP